MGPGTPPPLHLPGGAVGMRAMQPCWRSALAPGRSGRAAPVPLPPPRPLRRPRRGAVLRPR